MFFAHSASVKRSATLPASSRFALFERTRNASTFICGRPVKSAERWNGPDSATQALKRFSNAAARRVDVAARDDVVDDRLDRLLVLRADREVVLGFTLAGAVERERCEAA